MSDTTDSEPEPKRYGAFGGVFTPSILTILGVIMFLRTGFIVGQAGVGMSVLILALCEGIVLLTAISIGAIATNTPVRGGGAYFLISRVLGPEFGGSIGLALFFAQALSIPFYILGFTEAMVDSFPGLVPHFRTVALTTTALLFLVNYVGTNWAIKLQYVVMGLLGLSIIVLFGGAALNFESGQLAENWKPSFTGDHGFWTIFAIYFPAVTGIMAGVNMSGDLKNPGRDLVRGTFAAIGVGFLVYVLEIILLGGSMTRGELVNRAYPMMLQNALFGAGFLVAAGVFAATLSSAIGSYMGAPRILQALGRDRIFSTLKPFAHGSKKTREPHRALVMTFVFSLVIVWFASGTGSRDAFNFLAAIVTMFFLGTYGMVNVAAFVETVGANPSFRPRFKMFHWSSAMLGAIGCLGAMLLISPIAFLISVAVVSLLYRHISRREQQVAFGDARRGFFYSSVTKNLLRLRDLKPDPKNWRPTILVLSGNPETRLTLVQYGTWFEAGRGILSVAQILIGEIDEFADRRAGALTRLRSFIEKNDLKVFGDVVVHPDFDDAVRLLLQAHSIGPIKPNLVMTGWPKDPERFGPYARHLNTIQRLGRSAVVVVDRGLPAVVDKKRIDIWWRGQENGSLMLILAHLLTSNWTWRQARVRLLRVVENEAGRKPAEEDLIRISEAARIDAERVIVGSQESFESILYKHSRGASVVFLGYEPPTEEDAEPFFERFEKLLAGLPTTILVNSIGEADLEA